MVEKQVVVRNRAGIHARPAALIVQTAAKFSSQVEFCTEHETINAKSIMGIITLGAGYNTAIDIRVDGPDEADALNALVHLFESRFEED